MSSNRVVCCLALAAGLLCASSAFALEPVTLQLKWTHAFQFAGYYAAKAKGYYRDAGLEVRIEEALPGVDPVADVLEGRAQFAVGTSSLLLQRSAGKPVVALAVIFQHSPYVLIARQTSPTQGVHDLVGRRVMLEPQSEELVAYLNKEGVPLERITKVQHSYDPRDLIEGKIDAIAGYVTNQPWYLDRAHIPYQVYTPRSAGIDFYGDNLFTSERQLREHPARVKAFRAASLLGWQYAAAHPEELVDLILAEYSQRHTREYFLFEALQTIKLIQPELIEVGYMYPGRWRHIAETYADLGMLPRGFPLEGFLYLPGPKPNPPWLLRALALALLLSAVASAAGLYVYRRNRTLARTVAACTRAENEVRSLNNELDARVRERTAQLEASLRELESFSYSLAHDLRTPLRGIDGWSQVLLEDYAGKLDAQGVAHLNQVRAEAQRIGRIIDDLLQLARVTRAPLAPVAVDLSALAGAIAARLRESQPGRGAQFEVQPGLSATGDARLLEIALGNLLGNAWKFTGTRPLARIEFGRKAGPGAPEFFVRDNGVGFDMAHAGKLFGPFERLHKPAQFSGSGIGLAIVQRIVQRHGGAIRAESAPDAGATFFFTLGEVAA